ncbi:MAG: hypothetical protein ACFB01_01300 [Cohaesibacteraceae bacterium]
MADDDAAAHDLTETLRQELETLETDVQKLSGDISKELAKALADGQALDDVLRKLVVSQSNSALSSSVDAVYGLAGSLGESLVGAALGGITGRLTGGTVVNMNVTAQDAASFSASETQIASSLSRAVARGNRSQ